jgi:putative ABC transport system permease protein
MAVATAAVTLLGAFSLPGRIPIADLDLRLSPTLVAVAIALGLVTSLVFGVAPAWYGSRASTQVALREGARGASRQPIRGALVATQVTLCVLLLLGSVAFGRAMRHALSTDFGFDTAHTTIVTITPSRARYTRARMADVESRISDGLRTEPWVEHAAWMSIAPLSGMMAWDVGIPGVTRPGQSASTEDNVVSPDFFDAMGIPLLVGRRFGAEDRADAPLVAIVNEAMARKYWPAGALGAKIETNPGAKNPEVATVIGVVGNMRRALAGVPSPMFYVPLAQQASEFDSTQTLVVRSRLSSGATVSALTATLPRLEPGVPMGAPETMVDHLGMLLMPQRLGLTLFILFAGLAVVLTTFGIYAVVAFAVAQRVREIGIRVALGAARGRVIRLVVRQGLAPVAIGAVLGGAAFAAAGATLKGFIFGLPTMTGTSVALAAAAVAALALGAMVIPARRALAVDPTVALRAE